MYVCVCMYIHVLRTKTNELYVLRFISYDSVTVPTFRKWICENMPI